MNIIRILCGGIGISRGTGAITRLIIHYTENLGFKHAQLHETLQGEDLF